MGVPIGDVARVSQVLLAQLQQSRTQTEDRTTPGLITSESVNTTAVQSSGNVETQTGFFLGDAGLLSNVNVGLQRVTDIENVTTNSITANSITAPGGCYVNGVDIHDSNITAYDKITLNSINIPRYMTRSGTVNTWANVSYRGFDISDDAQTIIYGSYGERINVVKIDSFFNIIDDATLGDDVSGGRFGEDGVAISADGLTVAANAPDAGGPYTGYGNVGKVFVFRYDGENWNRIGDRIYPAFEYPFSFENRIRFTNSRLGNSIALSRDGNTIVVGASGETNYNGGNVQLTAGAVYVYTYNGSSWSRVAELFSSSRSQSDAFGGSVFINKTGNKISVGCQGRREVYIYNNLSLVHKITNNSAPEFGHRVAINEDATVMVALSNNGHHIYNYNGVEWVETFFSSPVNYLVNATVSISDNSKEVIINGKRYSYIINQWNFYQNYSSRAKINGDALRVVDYKTFYFSTPNPTYKLDISGNANVFEMNAFKYYGDGGTLSNIVLDENVFLSSVNYNSANVSGSNTYNYYTVDTVTTTHSFDVEYVDIDSSGTRVVVSGGQASDYLPVVYDYDGSSWSNTQLTSATWNGLSGGLDNINSSVISSDGSTIVVASGYSVFVWRYNGSSWVESKYTQTDDEGTYYAGVSGDGNVILATNGRVDSYAGKLYSFINGVYTGSFRASVSSSDSRFGSFVKLNYDGTRAVTVDGEYISNNNFNGRIFLYSRNGTTWTNYKTFNAGYGIFGSPQINISEDFNTLVYMTRSASNSNSRTTKIHEYINGVWEEDTYTLPYLVRYFSINKSGNVIIANDFSNSWIIFKEGNSWTEKILPSGPYNSVIASNNSISLLKVVSATYPRSKDFLISEIRKDTTLNIDATNVNISGTLTKASGTFKIDHPLPNMESTHSLTHSFIEGPKADLLYRGKAQLENGSVIVNIDEVSKMTNGTFNALVRDVECFVVNNTNWDNVKGDIEENTLNITCQNTASNALVSWLVIGERKDKHMYTLDWTDNEGRVIPEKLKM